MRLRYVLALVFALATLRPVAAQNPEQSPARLSPEATMELVRAYVAGQRERLGDLDRVTLRERLAVTMETPFGQRESRTESILRGGLTREGWEREVVSHDALELSPRRAGPPPRRGGRDQPRGRRPPRNDDRGPDFRRMTRLEPLGSSGLMGLQPAGHAEAADLGGVPAWRVSLVPRRDAGPLQQATVWLSRADARLLRSRYTLRPNPERPVVTVTVEYARIGGVDVPRARTARGTDQLRRRLRAFTVRFEAEAEFDQVVLERRH